MKTTAHTIPTYPRNAREYAIDLEQLAQAKLLEQQRQINPYNDGVILDTESKKDK